MRVFIDFEILEDRDEWNQDHPAGEWCLGQMVIAADAQWDDDCGWCFRNLVAATDDGEWRLESASGDLTGILAYLNAVSSEYCGDDLRGLLRAAAEAREHNDAALGGLLPHLARVLHRDTDGLWFVDDSGCNRLPADWQASTEALRIAAAAMRLAPERTAARRANWVNHRLDTVFGLRAGDWSHEVLLRAGGVDAYDG
jgi:hypothetical protein